MFDPDYFQLELYNAPYNTEDAAMKSRTMISTIVPPGFEYGYSVAITGEQGDFFRIRFIGEEEHPVCSNCNDSSYFVRKGTLGTWAYNYSNARQEYVPVPLYKEPRATAKRAATIEGGTVVILDIADGWLFVETTGKAKKRRGWLSPQMQCGDPAGTFSCVNNK